MGARRPVIGVMGRGERASAVDEQLAEALGEGIAREHWILLTGGRAAGLMGAASRGAKRVPGSLTLGVLPTASGSVSLDVDVAIFTGMGDARNVVNVLSSDVVVICGDPGPGTASEAALAIKARKPLVLLGCPEAATSFFQRLSPRVASADSVEDAIGMIRELLASAVTPA
jgi:uncharacterized protein (TIGR00725 family)